MKPVFTLAMASTLAIALFGSAGVAFAEPSVTPDVSRAQADADAVLAELHGFCEKPRRPPSRDAINLCSLAKDVPNCDGFVKQCDEVLSPKRPAEPSPWLEALGRFFARIAPTIGWSILGLSIATLVYLIASAIWRRIKDKDAPPEQEDETPADVTVVPTRDAPPIEAGSAEAILARAEAALLRGDLRAALFGFLHASLRALDVRGAIRIARDRTNGEYVRSCGDEGARPHLRDIVYEVDVVQFGGREPEVERVRQVGQRAAALVRVASFVLALLMLATLTGCKKPTLPVATDPAGFDVAPALLKRQGFKLSTPDKPLARLTPPSADQPAHPMLLDVTRTPLDTDAVEGLERWVKGGGVLVIFGAPWDWPTAFRAHRSSSTSRTFLVQPAVPKIDCTDSSDECEEKAAAALTEATLPAQRGHVADGLSFKWAEQDGRPLAIYEGDAKMYAGFGDFGSGAVLGVASSDLLTNVGLARPENPAALVALLSTLDSDEIIVIDQRDGITPSGDPLSALMKAGLGLPLGHAFAFAVLLAFAVGARHRAPRAAPQEKRRAFVEHVEATGALYAHAKAAPHALASYGRFVVERMRTRMSRGADLATTLSQRSGVPRDECQRILDRATLVKAGDAAQGDELLTLRQLAELYARAADPMTPGQKPSGQNFRLRRGGRT